MDKNIRRRLAAACAAAAVTAVFTVSGCADSTASETITPTPTEVITAAPKEAPTEEPTETPTPEPSYVSFGEESANALSAVFENGTEQSIKGIEVRNSDDTEFGGNLVPDGQEITPGELFRLYVSPGATAESSSGTGEEETIELSAAADGEEIDIIDVEFNETYDVRLTLADDTQPVLYDLGFDDIDTGVITYSASDNVAYVTYVSTKTAETISTLEAQKARALDETAAAAEAEAGDDAAPTASKKTSAVSESTKNPSGGTSSGSSQSSNNGGGGGNSNEANDNTAADNGNDGGVHEEAAGGNNDGENNTGDTGGADEGPAQVVDTCIDEEDIAWND